MASDADIARSCNYLETDIPKLTTDLANLTSLDAAAGNYSIQIKNTATDATVTFSVPVTLDSPDDDPIVAPMITALNAAIKAVIGADDITPNTLRKAVADAKTAMEAFNTAL